MRITRLTCMLYIGTSLSRCLYNVYIYIYVYIYMYIYIYVDMTTQVFRRNLDDGLVWENPRIYRCQCVAAENGSVSVHNWGLGTPPWKMAFKREVQTWGSPARLIVHYCTFCKFGYGYVWMKKIGPKLDIVVPLKKWLILRVKTSTQ